MWCPYCGHDLRDDMPRNPRRDAGMRFKCTACGATCFMLWSKTGKISPTETIAIFRKTRSTRAG